MNLANKPDRSLSDTIDELIDVLLDTPSPMLTPPPLMATPIEQARQLRATDRELDRQRSIATREYAYGDGTLAKVMAIHNKQTENWLKLLNLYGMTEKQWLNTSESERRRLWGDC